MDEHHGRAAKQEFAAIVDAYQNKVFRLSYSILGNRALAEEAAQETLLRVWRALPTYDGRASMSTWIYAITRNTALTIRAQQRQHTPVPDSLAAPPPPEFDPDLARAIAELPEPYRQAVVLFHLEEKSYDETARMLGLPLGTLKTHLHRGRKILAESLGPPMMELEPKA